MTSPFSALRPAYLKEGANEPSLSELARKLRSLHDGDSAVIEAISIGKPAIRVLSEVLSESDPAGIHEPRTRAAQALAALGAHEVLREFVSAWKPAADPVQRMGDEAALGAAARALAGTRTEETFQALFEAARKHAVPGVIEALGEYRRGEVLPTLIAALGDDLLRAAAQEALRKLGQDALPALIEIAARSKHRTVARETFSETLRRRSALALLLELGVNADAWEKLSEAINGPDDETAILACRLGMTVADDAGKRACAQRLVGLLERAVWFLRAEIEDCLSANFTFAERAFEQALRDLAESRGNDTAAQRRLKQSLQRIKRKAAVSR